MGKQPARSEPTFLNLRCEVVRESLCCGEARAQMRVWGRAAPSMVAWGTSAQGLIWNPSPGRKGSVLDSRCGRGAGKRARIWAEPASMAGTWPQAWHSPSLSRRAAGRGPGCGRGAVRGAGARRHPCRVWREPGGRLTHLEKQCAAVRTHRSVMRLPPQKWLPLRWMLTCQGHSPSKASWPPTIRFSILGRPHTRGQGGGGAH